MEAADKRIEYRFVPEGTVVGDVEAGAFYVDVGSIGHDRVFDHHGGQAGREGAPASEIWNARDALVKLSRSMERPVIITHEHPDWNACWGVTLLKWVIEERELDPARIEALNTYSRFVLAGFNPSEGPVEKCALAVFEKLMDAVEMEESSTGPQGCDCQKIAAGELFFEFCYRSIVCYDDLKKGAFLSEDGPYGRAIMDVRDDYQVYLHDLQRGKSFTVLLRRRSGELHLHDGLKLQKPLSRLFKFWARNDGVHSRLRAGFLLLCVQWAQDNWIVSVPPSSGYEIRGLGDFLTAEEHRVNPPDLEEPHRPLYDCPNPWYDARGTSNEHTIVASPRGGTRLSQQRLEKLLKQFFKARKWKPAIQKPSWVRDKIVPFGVPVASLIAVLAIGWWLLHGRHGCDRWRDPLDLSDGKHVAIVIGVSGYDNAKDWHDLSTPANDARTIMRILTEEYGFENRRPDGPGSTLLVSGGEILPTWDNITRVIKETASKLTGRDSLLIYFAGHGKRDKTDTFGYWIPQDGTASEKTYVHINGWLHKVMQKCAARHIIIIADCCYAGKIFDRGPESTGTAFRAAQAMLLSDPKNMYRLPSRQALTSAYEVPVPDRDSREPAHSPFARCLIRKFRPGEDPAPPYITARVLYRQIDECLLKGDLALQPQLRRFEETCDDEGEFVFRRKAGP